MPASLSGISFFFTGNSFTTIIVKYLFEVKSILIETKNNTNNVLTALLLDWIVQHSFCNFQFYSVYFDIENG